MSGADREVDIRLIGNCHAHFDKDYFFDRNRLGDDAPIKWIDLEETLALVQDVLDRYSTAYDGNVFVLEPMNANDLNDLLDKLYKARISGNG